MLSLTGLLITSKEFQVAYLALYASMGLSLGLAHASAVAGDKGMSSDSRTPRVMLLEALILSRVAVSAKAALDKRTPEATAAWIMVETNFMMWSLFGLVSGWVEH